MANPLDDDIQFLKYVGPARAADFLKLEIRTVRDLIWTFPRDLSDRSKLQTIADCVPGEDAALVVRAVSANERRIRGGRQTILTVEFTDDTGVLEAVWFNSPWVKEKLPGQWICLFGKVKNDGYRLKIEHPQFEIMPEDGSESLAFGRIVPIYPCTGGLTQTLWRRVMRFALDSRLEHLEEIRDASYLEKTGLPDRKKAVHDMHFPPDAGARDKARERLAGDECLLLQLAVLSMRRHVRYDQPGRRFTLGPELDSRIRRLFPFKLTGAQDRCIREISVDMEDPRPMHRLLQGDVGSGKTAVATYAMLAAVANKAQACVMAPTGLLARQHHDTLSSFLANSDQTRVRLGMLIGGMPEKEKGAVLERLRNGTIDILCTTHAVVEDNVVFRDLGLVVVDEQHKFGVRQRAILVQKGFRPDTLVMTATPIPRSLALSVYGDLDVSVIDGLPPGRKPVKTELFSQAAAGKVWRLIGDELSAGRQAFIVSPLVEESEELDVKSAEELFAELTAGPLSAFPLALMHGRMKRKEQLAVMDRFRSGEIAALVATVVIEVGVDVPNATVMAVAHAERFGLAQLHQLRGRVGRGREQGRFILLSDSRGEEANRRLAVLVRTSDGFVVAEEDLQIRGPGEFLGVRQHGLAGLKLVDLTKDFAMIRAARQEAGQILTADPELVARENLPYRYELTRMYGKQWDRAALG